MLTSRPTKFNAGITIGGDYYDFASIHETIHHLASDAGLISGNHFEFVLGLAYDFRKAKSGQRDKWDESNNSHADYYAVNILWPNFLVQLAMLRSACALLPTTKRLQADLYTLEACAEAALLMCDPAIGAECTRWLADFSPLPDSFLVDFVAQQNRDFLYGAKQGKPRFRQLPRILADISPYSNKYQEFERHIKMQASENGVRPQDMIDLSEWPEFNW